MTGWAAELLGRGQVGGALLPLLRAGDVPVAAIHRSRGVEAWPLPGRRLLVDCTPPRLAGPEAEAWVARLEAALRAGTPLVTCNKAPLAIAWSRLDAAAREGGVPVAATATVGGGTPVLPWLRRLAAGPGVREVEATLSGTLALVVGQVHAGATLADAVRAAQAAGYCEPDPRVDLEGTDAWAKACILHNALWPGAPALRLADRPAPLALREDAIRGLGAPAVVARIALGAASLALGEWSGPPHGIQVRAHLADGSVARLGGTGAGVASTARALLGDVLDVVAGRLGPGLSGPAPAATATRPAAAG